MRATWIALGLVAAARVAPAQSASAVTALEAAIIAETNAARTDPAGYARHLEALLPYYEGRLLRLPGRTALRTEEGAAAVREAIAALRATPPLRALTLSPGLARAARDHAEDLGPRGALGHEGRDGSRMQDRVSRYGGWDRSLSENITYGSETARDVVVDLLIDDGVAGRGHRRNILNPESRYGGAGCAPHTRYRLVCVIDYAGEFVESNRGAAAAPAAPRPAAATPRPQPTTDRSRNISKRPNGSPS
jgi:uncharacterized protein YkwD